MTREFAPPCFPIQQATAKISSFHHRLEVQPHRLIPDMEGVPVACGLSRVLRKGQKRVPLQAVQVMMDTRKEGFTKSHLPDAMVAGIPAKEMQVGEVSPPSAEMGPSFVGGRQ